MFDSPWFLMFSNPTGHSLAHLTATFQDINCIALHYIVPHRMDHTSDVKPPLGSNMKE